MMKTTQKQIFAKEGYTHLLVTLLMTVAGSFLDWRLGLVTFAVFLFVAFFFRNPTRVTPQNESSLICPADGKIVFMGPAVEPDFLKKEMQRVTIFMSPFDVHVNRSPLGGQVLGKVYHEGKYLAAFNEKASLENERSALWIRSTQQQDVVFVQIAGWFARRIVSYPVVNDTLAAGEIFGVIKYGSRMDVYFSDDWQIDVELGQKVRAGETILAQLKNSVR